MQELISGCNTSGRKWENTESQLAAVTIVDWLKQQAQSIWNHGADAQTGSRRKGQPGPRTEAFHRAPQLLVWVPILQVTLSSPHIS